MFNTLLFSIRAWFAEKIKRSGAYAYWRGSVGTGDHTPFICLIECEVTVGKVEIRQQLAQRSRRGIFSRRASSSGTSGVPLVFSQSFDALQREQAFIDWMWEVAGFSPSSKVAVIRGSVVPGGIARTLRRMYVSGEGWSDLDVKRKVDALRRFKPDFIHCYPSVLERLLLRAVSLGVALPESVGFVLAGSEEITHSHVRTFKDLLGAKTLGWYGQSEQVALAVREDDGTYSFVPEYSEVAFIESDGKFEIVGRSRCNGEFSTAWYRTGDFCGQVWVGLSQSLQLPTIRCADLQGRSAISVELRDGRRVPFNQVVFGAHTHLWSAIERYCFIQSEPGRLILLFARSDSVDDAGLEQFFIALRGSVSDFDLVFEEEPSLKVIRAEKWQYFYSSVEDFRRQTQRSLSLGLT